MTNEDGDIEVREATSGHEEELEHHVVSVVGKGAREDEVGGDGKDAKEKEEELRDHYSIRLVNTHSFEVGLEAFELVIGAREATCI